MRFADIVGQDKVKSRIVSLVKMGRIPHALMFAGQQGVGKLPMAIATAQFMCCENTTDIDSCGHCSSCIKFAKLEHPDLHFMFPIVQSKTKGIRICDDVLSLFRQTIGENPYAGIDTWLKVISDGKMGVIYKQEGDELIRKLSMKPYESKCQVMIVWMPEKMNDECANHLLKFVEEPPKDTYILFVTDSEDEVLRTIYSRTQKIYVPPIDKDSMTIKARTKYEIDEKELAHLVRVSHGSWNRFMLEMSVDTDNREMFRQFMTMMRVSWVLNMKEVKAWSETMSGYSRDKQQLFLQVAQIQIRENFISRVDSSDLLYMNAEESGFAVKFSRFIHENNIEDMIAELQLAEEQIEQNVSSKIIFFHLPFILYRLMKRSNE